MVGHELHKIMSLQNLISQYLERFDSHIQELLRGATVAVIFKIFAAFLMFGLNVVLARLLGAEGAGIFFLAFTIVLIVAAIARVGMENALVRFIAVNIEAEQPGKVLGVYQKAMKHSLVIAAILSILLFFLAPLISQVIFSKPELAKPLTIMAIAIVPLALLTLHAHALQGLKKIAASISVLSIYVPLLTTLIAFFLLPYYGINAAVWGYLFATVVTLFIGILLWRRSVFRFKSHISEFNSKELHTSSMPLFGVVMMNMVITWSPILFLGIWENSENIGIYSAASRTAMLISFVLVAVNSIAAPKFAALYQHNGMDELGIIARKSAKIMIIFASPALLIFMMMPEWVLSIFGEQFKQGANVLMILAVGQFINVATGSVGYLLMMTGNERIMRNNLMFCAFVGIVLNLWLIPKYGIIGGAVAAAFTLALQNLIAVILAWKKLKVMLLPWVNMV
jgi:O-antigen/teichoic acid export membrane protein